MWELSSLSLMFVARIQGRFRGKLYARDESSSLKMGTSGPIAYKLSKTLVSLSIAQDPCPSSRCNTITHSVLIDRGVVCDCQSSVLVYVDLQHKLLSTSSIYHRVKESILHSAEHLFAQKVPVKRMSLELEPTYTLKVPEGTFHAWLATSQ